MPGLLHNSGSIAKLCENDSAMKRNELAELSRISTVAEERSFTRAAVRLGISPSALGHSMRGLEKSLGIQRFIDPFGVRESERSLLINDKRAMATERSTSIGWPENGASRRLRGRSATQEDRSTAIAAWRTPLWLRSGWECRSRRLSTG
jgi:hypothetical protein